MVFLIMHPIITIPANSLIDKFGTKQSLVLGSILTIIGGWLRYFIDYGVGFMIVGMILCGTGRPFIINSQSKFAADWYYPKNRTLVTSLLTFTLVLAKVFGLIIPGLIFGNYVYENNPESIHEGKQLTELVLFIEAMGATLMLIFTIVFFRDKP
jgi:FLVCR family feline leukemia virus subgroup C receptor-related protein